MSTRAAAVAGYFYDADPDRLRHDISQLLDTVDIAGEAMPEVLIVPHAGYIYSGATAACAYRRLMIDPGNVSRVLLIGPAHRIYVDGMAIPDVDCFATPLGEVALDRPALEQIAALPGVQYLDEAHHQEHSLEVQLPFLQSVLTGFTLVPVLVGAAPAEQVAAVVDSFAEDPHTLVVISTDLSHFHEYDRARREDALTCESILDKSVNLDGRQACGAAAINGLMASKRVRNMRVRLLQACNSGDTAGQRDRVVGYAAFSLY